MRRIGIGLLGILVLAGCAHQSDDPVYNYMYEQDVYSPTPSGVPEADPQPYFSKGVLL